MFVTCSKKQNRRTTIYETRFTWRIYKLNKNTFEVILSCKSTFSSIFFFTVRTVTFHTPAWVSLASLMRNVHVSFLLSMHSISPLIRWNPGMHSNLSSRLVSRMQTVFPTDSTFNSTVEPDVEVTTFSARVFEISSIARKSDEIRWNGILVDVRRKSGMIFCLSRKNATLDKFRNKRKVGCALLYGDDCRAGMQERKEKRERMEVTEGGLQRKGGTAEEP